MNTAQIIYNIILKSMFYDLFKKTCTTEEKKLIKGLKTIHDLRIEKTLSRRLVLQWHSVLGYHVACYVDDQGFYFSQVELYKQSTRRMKGLVKEHFIADDTRHSILETEIREIKEMILSYSRDAEMFFK